jgi:hypothetical protein
MSVFVSKATPGNWSSLSTWFQDGAAATRLPGDGDTVTIASGHTLTADLPASIGTGSGIAIQLGNDGAADASLIVNAPLTVKGHIDAHTGASNYSLVFINSGGGIELDGNPGFRPRIQANYYNNGPLRIIFNGTAATPAYLRTNAAKATAGEQAYFTGLSSGTEASYVDFQLGVEGSWGRITDLGDKTRYGVWLRSMRLRPGTSSRAVLSDTRFVRANLKFDAWTSDNGDPRGGLVLRNITMSQTPTVLESSVYQIGAYLDGAGSSGNDVLELDGCGFDRAVWLNHALSVADTVFGRGFFTNTGPPGSLARTWSNVLLCEPSYIFGSEPDPLMHLTMSGSAQVYGRTHCCYFGNVVNPHFVYPTFNKVGTITLNDFSWEAPIVAVGSGGFADDMCDSSDIPAGCSTHINRPLLIPTMSGSNPGAGIGLGEFGGGNGVFIDRLTCPQFGDPGQGASMFIDSSSGHGGTDGAIQQLTNSLFYQAAPGGKVFGVIGVTDPIVASGVHHNCLYNGTYNFTPPSGSFGAGDIHADPQMVDASRNLVTYWRTQVGASDPSYAPGQTAAHDLPLAIVYMVANPGTVPALIDWIRGGFAPTNAALKGAASDGGDIGAVPVRTTSPRASSYSLDLSGGGDVGTAVIATLTPDAAYGGTITLTPSGCGLSAPVTIVFDDSAAPLSATFTPTQPGTLLVTATNSGGLADPPCASRTIVGPQPITYTLTAPSLVPAGSGVPVAVTPSGSTSGSVTLTPSGCGVSAPVTLAWNEEASPRTAEFWPSRDGTLTVTVTGSSGPTTPECVTILVASAATSMPLGRPVLPARNRPGGRADHGSLFGSRPPGRTTIPGNAVRELLTRTLGKAGRNIPAAPEPPVARAPGPRPGTDASTRGPDAPRWSRPGRRGTV